MKIHKCPYCGKEDVVWDTAVRKYYCQSCDKNIDRERINNDKETDKQIVVNRLLGKCECESDKLGCFNTCRLDEEMHCSRDRKHKGRHFACTVTQHKVYEWD